MHSAEDYFKCLYPPNSFGSVIFCEPVESVIGYRRLATFAATDTSGIAKFAADPSRDNLYYKYNLFDETSIVARGSASIGSKTEVQSVVAFGLDIDCAEKSVQYASRAEALATLNSMPQLPSAVINSDGSAKGLHGYWFFDKPIVVMGPEHYDQLVAIARRWNRKLAELLSPFGEVDATAGLERLLRPPGALRKSGNRVTVEQLHPTRRYTLEELTLPLDTKDLEQLQKQQLFASSTNEGPRQDSDILDYLTGELGYADISNLMQAYGWSERSGAPGFWDRPEATSGAPTGEVWKVPDGRLGLTIKTPGRIRTAAVDSAGNVIDFVPEQGGWYSFEHFFVFMSTGGDTQSHWSRCAAMCREQSVNLRAQAFDSCSPINLILPSGAQKFASGEDVQKAKDKILCSTGDTGSRIFNAARQCVAYGLSDPQAVDVILEIDAQAPFGMCPLIESDIPQVLRSAEQKTRRGKDANGDDNRNFLDPERLAREVAWQLGYDWDEPKMVRLRYYREQWFHFDGCKYTAVPEMKAENLIRIGLLAALKERAEFLNALHDIEVKNAPNPDKVKPPTIPAYKTSLLKDVVSEFAFLCFTEACPEISVSAPELTEKAKAVCTDSGIAVIGETGQVELLPSDPRVFTLNSINFGFNASAACPRWLEFLEQVWPGDQASKHLLQEWFGLNIVDDTSFQKIMWIIGTPRSGKSTITSILKYLAGDGYGAVDFNTLARPHGTSALLGKRTGIISDVRATGDRMAALEKLLMISGADGVTVEPKFKTPFSEVLPVRFTIVSNEMPYLPDASSAMFSRGLFLKTSVSFQGREDRSLLGNLKEELPGIFNWAVQGLARLNCFGKFTEPQSADDLRRTAKADGNPLLELVEDFFAVGPTEQIPKDLLYRWYAEWCKFHNTRVLTSAIFHKRLNAMPGLNLQNIRPGRAQSGTFRRRTIQGIGLRKEFAGVAPEQFFLASSLSTGQVTPSFSAKPFTSVT